MGSLAHTAGFSVSSHGPAFVYGDVDDISSFHDDVGPYGSNTWLHILDSANISGYMPGPNRVVATVCDDDGILDIGFKVRGTGGSFSVDSIHTDGFGWNENPYNFAYETDALSASVGLDGPGRFRLDARDVDFNSDGVVDFSSLTLSGKASAPASFSAGIFQSSLEGWSVDGFSTTEQVDKTIGGNAGITLFEAGHASLKAVGVTQNHEKLVFNLGLTTGDDGGSVQASVFESISNETVWTPYGVSVSHVEESEASFSAYLPGGGHAEAVVAGHPFDYFLG